MIRAILHQGSDAPMVLLGLDRVCIDRIMDGVPFVVNLRHLDPLPGSPSTDLPEIEVAIAYDDDRHQLQDLLDRIRNQ